MRTENERKSLQEILKGTKEGRSYDPAGIRTVTENFAACKGTEMLTELPQGDMTKEEWYEELCRSAYLPASKRSYYYIVHSLSLMAEERGVDNEALLFLMSLFFLGGKNVKPYMGIAVADLLKAAGLEELYDSWFRTDAELFSELKGRPATVKDVLKNCFELFEPFVQEHGLRPYDIIRNRIPGAKDSITKPFFRKSGKGREDTLTVVEYLTVWIWTLMVEAPLRILRPGNV